MTEELIDNRNSKAYLNGIDVSDFVAIPVTAEKTFMDFRLLFTGETLPDIEQGQPFSIIEPNGRIFFEGSIRGFTEFVEDSGMASIHCIADRKAIQ